MTSTPEILRRVTRGAPLVATPLDFKQLATVALAWADDNVTVRTVRGTKMHTVQGLFDEIAAALQFPYYFGENWAAFDECLSDLDWLSVSNPVVIVVYDADQVLLDAHPSEFETFAEILRRASSELGNPIEDGESWDRPALAFHLVLHLPSGITKPWEPDASLVKLGRPVLHDHQA